ncbi:Carboxypeptidase T [Alloactinosynnema sp. L-07]|uniref:M14 family zinc carboxypeptidase n=1 Tax=Alloactinosynnema sp. L-07 TaxID=1653480 RepID=UPI00065EF546|nr:M14 family zinc carboxypeptidase [Alloactinosynnema sp. L-07]CRK56681.1 Carboxypeptidase T [Alloactinosynnema sp. L-07]
MKRKRLSVMISAAAALALIATAGPNAAGHDSAAAGSRASAEYHVLGVTSVHQRTAISRTGAAINGVEDSRILITATESEVATIRGLGFTVGAEEPMTIQADGATAMDFPPTHSDYHNYSEMVTEINRVVAAHPSLITKQVIGSSYEGRELYALKISDNAGTDENEPEVLFTHHQHAREILTVEMALYLANELTAQYATDTRIKNLVDNREIWILPNVNPDGGEFDIATGQFQSWRKNRQPNAGSTAVGTDTNRNWAYLWGCCGGSSGTPSSDTYRGPRAESTPEVKAVADFVRGRVVGGKQQISVAIDFHTHSELILWPYGHTYNDTAPGLTAEDQRIFATIGREMAGSNGYTPQQSSDLYITDGSIKDWLWGDQKIYGYTFEMYPTSGGGGGFYPDDSVIPRETSRNKEAVLDLLGYADCPKRSIGLTCAVPGGTFENPGDVSILDAGSAVTSDISVSGLPGNAPSDLRVSVDIKHTYRGDLVIDLIAPDGTAYRLKDVDMSDSADNVIATYTVNASAEPANGTWKLHVRDAYVMDVGYVDLWKVQV